MAPTWTPMVRAACRNRASISSSGKSDRSRTGRSRSSSSIPACVPMSSRSDNAIHHLDNRSRIMTEIKASSAIDHRRRRFIGSAAMSLAAAGFGMSTFAQAQTAKTKLSDVKPGTNTSFGPLKQVDAGLLNVGYAEAGPADGAPVVLLHGWPYDIHSFVDVAPLLASAGYRVIVPYLRGYGSTRFLSADTFRNAQPAE